MPTVLVVDDSEVDRRLAGALLERAIDVRVVYAPDGAEGLKQVELRRPDVVVTDLRMPEMDGLELVAAIKNDFSQVPVILMTAEGSEDIAAEALRAGAASYVPKKRLAQDLPDTLLRVLDAANADRSHSHLMHHLTDDQAHFVLPNDLTVIQALVDHLQQTLRCLPLVDETERLRVGIALDEALSNAYYHGNLEVGSTIPEVDHEAYAELAQQRLTQSPYRTRQIYVHVAIDRSQAVYVIRDEGPGFDTAELPSELEEKHSDRVGRGVILMRTIMDEVRYNEAGNEVTLVKRRSPETIEDHSLDDDAEALPL